MHRSKHLGYFLFIIIALLMVADPADAAKKRRKRRYLGPPPTNPVVLWARTLNQGTDPDQREAAAFKMSQYSQRIYQEEAVSALLKCIKDPETKIKVWCSKAMGRAGTQSNSEIIRQAMLEQYKNDSMLKDTLVRAFIVRSDDSPKVHDTLLDALKKSEDAEEQTTLLGYFEKFGDAPKVVGPILETYRKSSSQKVKMAAVTALENRAQGQEEVVALLAQCASEHDSNPTPLVLNCLSGLQQQAKKDARTWTAVEKTLQSDDADVVYATLDLINTLAEAPNPKISERLLSIISDVDDDDTLERAILALGVAGNHTEGITTTLRNQLANKSSADGVRIAAALVLGKQGVEVAEAHRDLLTQCSKQEKSQSLKTACQLGLQEIETRKTASQPAATPAKKD